MGSKDGELFFRIGIDERIIEVVKATQVGLFILDLMNVLNIDRYEKLKFCLVRLDIEDDRVTRIGHVHSDRWLRIRSI